MKNSKRGLSSFFKMELRDLLAIIILISNAFSWYFVMYNLLAEISNLLLDSYFEVLQVWLANSIAISFSAIMAAKLGDKGYNRLRFLFLWIMAGVFCSFVPLLIDLSNSIQILLISIILGSSWGFGMPACMAYYSDITTVMNRGKIGGIAFFASYLWIFLFGQFTIYDLKTQFLILTAWRVFGLMFFFLKSPKISYKTKKSSSYLKLLRDKQFLLYFIAWTMFCSVNYLTMPVLYAFYGEDLTYVVSMLVGIIGGIFGFISGILCDVVGRKRVVISGFILLGLGYATLGIFSDSQIALFFFAFTDGAAFGTFGATFLTTLWGDIAHGMMSEKYYALGGLPFLFLNFLQVILGEEIMKRISINTIFSLASFFLFLAVFPLMYAAETLPEKVIKERELRSYVEKAKKIREKYEKRKG